MEAIQYNNQLLVHKYCTHILYILLCIYINVHFCRIWSYLSNDKNYYQLSTKSIQNKKKSVHFHIVTVNAVFIIHMANLVFCFCIVFLLYPLVIKGTLAKYEDPLDEDVHDTDNENMMESEAIHEYINTGRINT